MSEPTTTRPKPSAAGLIIVYVTVFIDLLGFGIILPALPFYAEKYGANGVWVGVMMASYSAAQLVGASLLGRLSDRIGRRPVLLLSLAGSTVSFALSGVAQTLALLVISRALAGAFGGSIPAAQAFVADLTAPQERAKYMGMLGASIGLGFVFGPGIGAVLSGYGFGVVAFVASGIALANFIAALFLLKESLPKDGARRRSHFDLGALVTAMRHPGVGHVLVATFFATLGMVFLETTYALFGEQAFGLTPRTLGFLFTGIGVVGVIVQGGLVGRFAKRFGEAKVGVLGALISAVAFSLVPLLPTLALGALVLMTLAVGQGLLNPMLPTLLSREVGADEQGGTLGLGQSASAGARALGPIMAGFCFDWHHAAPYVAAALSAVVVMLLLLRGATGVVAPAGAVERVTPPVEV